MQGGKSAAGGLCQASLALNGLEDWPRAGAFLAGLPHGASLQLLGLPAKNGVKPLTLLLGQTTARLAEAMWEPGAASQEALALASRLAPLGVIHELALLGHTPQVHDFVAGKKGDFKRRLARAVALWQAGVGRRVVFTAHKSNFRHLPQLPELLRRLGARALRVDFPPPALWGEANASRAVARLPLAAGPLARLGLTAQGAGLKVSVRGMPPCVFDDGELPATLTWEPPLAHHLRLEAEGQCATETAHLPVPACAACPHNARCPGVAADYLDLFGLAEWPPAATAQAS